MPVSGSAELMSWCSTASLTRLMIGLDRDAASDLAGVVATHAVGQHEQPDVGIDADGVFVVLAHTTDVAQPDGTDLASHRRARHARDQ